MFEWFISLQISAGQTPSGLYLPDFADFRAGITVGVIALIVVLAVYSGIHRESA